MDIVNKSLIQEYANRNTSNKLPIESKYVNAFVDSILNSTDIIESYDSMKNKCWNNNEFLVFNSLWNTCKIINLPDMRPIVAYSMFKKDEQLFRLISQFLFTGSIELFYGRSPFILSITHTDTKIDESQPLSENNVFMTDSDTYTDMNSTIPQIAFYNYYCDTDSGEGSEYQTPEELLSSLEIFKKLITVVKPARVGVQWFSIPYCYYEINNSDSIKKMVTIKQSVEDSTQKTLIKNTDMNSMFYECNSSDTMFGFKLISRTKDENSFVFEIKFHARVDDTNSGINWGDITIKSNIENVNDIIIVPDVPEKQMSLGYYICYFKCVINF